MAVKKKTKLKGEINDIKINKIIPLEKVAVYFSKQQTRLSDPYQTHEVKKRDENKLDPRSKGRKYKIISGCYEVFYDTKLANLEEIDKFIESYNHQD